VDIDIDDRRAVDRPADAFFCRQHSTIRSPIEAAALADGGMKHGSRLRVWLPGACGGFD